MGSVTCLLAAATVSGLCGTAWAQASTPPPTPGAQAIAAADHTGLTRSHWLASGFVGSNFASTNNDLVRVDRSRTFDVGGQIGYLWRGIVGGEFLVNFTPSFEFDTVGALLGNPRLTSYMANAVAVLPLGAKGQFQPYVSGGLGSIAMTFPNGIVGSGLPTDGVVVADVTSSSISQTGGGSNIGGGIMAFAGKVGVRGDVRYYHSNTVSNLDTANNLATQVTQGLLSGLNFWRTDIGVAFQW